MKNLKLILCLIIGALAVSSCQSVYTTDPGGLATINVNKFRLPSSIGVLEREYITGFDGAGHNVGAGYNYYSPQEKTALTVFIVSDPSGSSPSNVQLEQYFQASRKEVMSAHEQSETIRTTRADGHRSFGTISEFRYNEVFARTQQRVVSFLAVFRDGNRLIKYRITAPEAERDQVHSRLMEAIRTLTKIN